MNIFLAFSFRDEDKSLVNYIDRLISGHLDRPLITGKKLGGGQLAPEVQKRIEESDALIALMTRDTELVGGGWTTHKWVIDELGWARAKNKQVIAIVEDGVNVSGMFQANEYIPLNRHAPLEALIYLAETVGEWRKNAGRLVKVQIAPETIANKLGDDNVTCRRRLCRHGKYTDWQEVTPVRETGGTFISLDGVQDEHLIEVEARDAGNTWRSLATSQWLLVQLNAKGAGA